MSRANVHPSFPVHGEPIRVLISPELVGLKHSVPTVHSIYILHVRHSKN